MSVPPFRQYNAPQPNSNGKRKLENESIARLRTNALSPISHSNTSSQHLPNHAVRSVRQRLDFRAILANAVLDDRVPVDNMTECLEAIGNTVNDLQTILSRWPSLESVLKPKIDSPHAADPASAMTDSTQPLSAEQAFNIGMALYNNDYIDSETTVVIPPQDTEKANAFASTSQGQNLIQTSEPPPGYLMTNGKAEYVPPTEKPASPQNVYRASSSQASKSLPDKDRRPTLRERMRATLRHLLSTMPSGTNDGLTSLSHFWPDCSLLKGPTDKDRLELDAKCILERGGSGDFLIRECENRISLSFVDERTGNVHHEDLIDLHQVPENQRTTVYDEVKSIILSRLELKNMVFLKSHTYEAYPKRWYF